MTSPLNGAWVYMVSDLEQENEALREQLTEAQAAIRAVGEAVQNYFAGCSYNKYGKPCGGDWPCDHVQIPLRKIVALPAVKLAMRAAEGGPDWVPDMPGARALAQALLALLRIRGELTIGMFGMDEGKQGFYVYVGETKVNAVMPLVPTDVMYEGTTLEAATMRALVATVQVEQMP